ncbi:MAG TPA: M28 family peptidase, partial [Pilimelia sp.]|nr:M28 family peptidase [Pilimelia sp.]
MASPPSVPRPARWPAWVAVAAVLAASAGAMLDLRPPAAVPATAPPTDFSAHRAHAQLAVVADRPHAAGSAAADRVREHLIARLRGLGLDTSVQDTVAPEAGQLSGGAGTVAVARVRNVVAVLPGTAPTGRVFLVAHYDSVQTGPGGNDDGAGVGAVLEVARALAAGPRPRNDTVFVLTDAEEACLCGASAFAAGHPLARDGGVVLNLEARGSTGPVVMFETSTDNAALVAAFARAAPHPVGTSFAVEVYRLLPNDTDFTAFLAAGFTGLNSAYLDGSAVYHTPLDTPAAVDLRSLQHHGDNALGLAREFGRADLAALSATGDATYFPVPGGLIRYPGWLTWPLAALTVLAVAGLAGLARRRRLLTWPRLAAAGGLALGPLVLCPVAAQALWWAVTALRPGYAELVDPYRPVPFRLAALALAAAVLLGWYAAARRRVGGTALAIGALAWLALLGVGLAAVVPGGAYLATLPALAGAGAGALAMLPRGVPAPRALLVSAAASAGAGIVAGVVLLPAMVLLLPALGMATVGAAAFLGVLFAMVALPLLESVHPSPHAGRPRWRRAVAAAAAPATATLAAIGLAVAGLAVNGFDAAHPMPTHLMYALDTETGRAQWLSFEEEPLP